MTTQEIGPFENYVRNDEKFSRFYCKTCGGLIERYDQFCGCSKCMGKLIGLDQKEKRQLKRMTTLIRHAKLVDKLPLMAKSGRKYLYGGKTWRLKRAIKFNTAATIAHHFPGRVFRCNHLKNGCGLFSEVTEETK